MSSALLVRSRSGGHSQCSCSYQTLQFQGTGTCVGVWLGLRESGWAGVAGAHTDCGACVSLQSIIFDEVDLTDASVAESSTKNVNNSFTVRLWATPFLIPHRVLLSLLI